MAGRLEGKVCVITGAGGGMGRDAALLFTEEGAKVYAADMNLAAAEETASLCSGEAFAFQANVAEEADVEAMMAATAERFGGIDVLYNNAGISPDDDASVLDTSVEAWDRVQAVNTRGVFLCCKHGIPRLLERGGGSVINVASFVAILGAATSQISYSASKGAVLSMSRELGVQFARQGVRVNALCPGPVETPLLLNIFGDDPEALERRRIHWPMGRLAKPREIVNAALFLASDESSYVNASTFLVDGGLTAAYAGAKTALEYITRIAAVEYGGGGVRVNCIAPHLIETPMTAPIFQMRLVVEAVRLQTPLARMGSVDDVANAALFLASDESAYITGQTLCIDGGASAQKLPSASDYALLATARPDLL